mmetsp:Transcript_18288/g.38324  ORF Transcript_18288/g.38324 Transcript_18288/m.38324 type:complete len:199 (+) Transcript_18288:48-644(+)
MVLDLCPEFYVGGKENLLWQPEIEEHQRRCWLAPKPDVAADNVSKKMPKAAPAGPATTLAPAALSSRYVQISPAQKLSGTYASARSITGCPGYSGTAPKSAVTVAKPASSLLVDRSRCVAFPSTTQHPAVIIKGVHSTAPRVTMRIVQPATFMPYMQVRAPSQPVYLMPRETSYLGGYLPPVYAINRIVLPPRVLLRA